MSKKYSIPETEPQKAGEPAVAYTAQPTTLHLDINLEDNAVVADIKKAIKMIKGIAGIRVSVKQSAKLSGIDRGLEDIKQGNVFHAKDSTDLVNQIFG